MCRLPLMRLCCWVNKGVDAQNLAKPSRCDACCCQAAIEARPMLFGSFMATGSEDQPLYAQVEGYDVLRKALDAKLAEYNESNASMDLVLFQQVSWLIALHVTTAS